ncbi:MAG: PVC-type heme-binding CxxCH protein [Cyclobacteriaceae bacterium]
MSFRKILTISMWVNNFPFQSLVPVGLLAGLMSCGAPDSEPTFYPEVLDDRLTLELISTSPQIMTPIGLAIDDQDQIYVLESHTHSPPSDYAGPSFDRIKKGVDTNQDGKPESWLIYADSITDGMNLAVGPDNTIFLTEKDGVYSYQDIDGNGAADQKTQLLKMNTPKSVYDHSGILGVTYAPEGWLYVSRGNSGGLDRRIEGTDGSFIEGYGDGGNVFRCRADGSQVEEIATGFWNPFDIKFTKEGRLMLVDNDPDSRGPNRLIDIVPGGDYGYQSLYGGSGIHPFLAWNGELPGTLPYAAALGEAPSGLIDASFTSFSNEYDGNVLVTIWEENAIVRVPLQAKMSTVTGEAKTILQGDSPFHPVALATNSWGDLYFTDWVVRQYPNHGQGRVWRLASGSSQPLATALTEEEIISGHFSQRFAPRDTEILLADLSSEDAFVRASTRHLLRDSAYYQDVLTLTQHTDPKLRLEGLLVLLKSTSDLSEADLRRLLNDQDEAVRRIALTYVAQHARDDLSSEVDQLLASGKITSPLFETYLATLRHLQPVFVQEYRTRANPESKKLQRKLPPTYLADLIQNTDVAEEIRALALSYLDNPAEIRQFLVEALLTASEAMQMATLQAFKSMRSEDVANATLQLALDRNASPLVRGQALVTLEYQSTTFCDEVASILNEDNELLSETAVGYLCRCRQENVEETVAQFVSTNPVANSRWQLCRTDGSEADRPTTSDEWYQAVDDTGNAARGNLVFQSISAQCQSCHKIDGWGSSYGPDLSNIGSSKSAQQLAMAILEPSAEIAPEWQGWFVTDSSGVTHLGRQIDVGFKNVELMVATGDFVTYKQPQRYGPAATSLMPDGLENTMTPAEFNDLIAYLTSLK